MTELDNRRLLVLALLLLGLPINACVMKNNTSAVTSSVRLHKQIAFLTVADNDVGIFAMEIDGSNLLRLSSSVTKNSCPVWSADGEHILFVSNLDGNPNLYVMDANGTSLSQLTHESSAEIFHASWSPDGRYIVFDSTRDGFPNIYRLDISNQSVDVLTNLPAVSLNPAWSPATNHIVYSSNRAILTSDTNYYDFDIYIMNSDGRDSIALTSGPGSDHSPRWSSDGSHIAFYSDREGNNDIYTMSSDGSNLIRLTDGSSDDRNPAWSPEGDRIVFISNRDSNPSAYDIYMMNSDGSNTIRITEIGNTNCPDWRP